MKKLQKHKKALLSLMVVLVAVFSIAALPMVEHNDGGDGGQILPDHFIVKAKGTTIEQLEGPKWYRRWLEWNARRFFRSVHNQQTRASIDVLAAGFPTQATPGFRDQLIASSPDFLVTLVLNENERNPVDDEPRAEGLRIQVFTSDSYNFNFTGGNGRQIVRNVRFTEGETQQFITNNDRFFLGENWSFSFTRVP